MRARRDALEISGGRLGRVIRWFLGTGERSWGCEGYKYAVWAVELRLAVLWPMSGAGLAPITVYAELAGTLCVMQ
jgi:hypothetical protein